MDTYNRIDLEQRIESRAKLASMYKKMALLVCEGYPMTDIMVVSLQAKIDKAIKELSKVDPAQANIIDA